MFAYLKKIITHARLAQLLGASGYAKARFFIVALWLPIRKKLGLHANPIRLDLNAFQRSFFFWVKTSVDMAVLREIFLDTEYDVAVDEDPAVIFDLGSNSGASVAYFKLKYPAATIYAFEPNPDCLAVLKKNTEQFSGVSIFPYAVSDRNERRKFYVHPESSISASFRQRLSGHRPVEVECKTLDTLMRELGTFHIDLLKFDIEGAEMEAFKRCMGIARIHCFVGELHLDLVEAGREEFLSLFEGCEVILRQLSLTRCIVSAFRAPHERESDAESEKS